MKKFLLSSLLCFMALTITAQEYVDLGLPSGTLWKSTDEQGLYTYSSARYYFKDALPNKAQVKELFYNCTWKWTGKGYKVTGPNQNSIYFAFNGYKDCDDDMHDEGSSAVLWTLDNAGANYAYFYIIWDQGREIVEDANCRSCAVRLVKQDKSGLLIYLEVQVKDSVWLH